MIGFAGIIVTLNQKNGSTGENTPPPPPPSTATATAVATTQATTTAPPTTLQPQERKVHIETDPSGATIAVKDGQNLCDSTPCDIPFRGADAAADKIHRLTVSKKGYKSKDIKVSPVDEKVKVSLDAIVKTTTGTKTTTPGWAPNPF